MVTTYPISVALYLFTDFLSLPYLVASKHKQIDSTKIIKYQFAHTLQDFTYDATSLFILGQ